MTKFAQVTIIGKKNRSFDTNLHVRKEQKMPNLIQTTTEFAMYIASWYIPLGAVLIDATCGNGHDTLRLAKALPSKLYAFDIQPKAISATKSRLICEGFGKKLDDGTIRLICDSHERMASYITGKADAIVFNLGYLPGGDKNLTTAASSTISAAASAMNLLKDDGLTCITMYSGHPAGYEEKEELLLFAKNLDPRLYHTAHISMSNQPGFPPEILLITKKSRKKG